MRPRRHVVALALALAGLVAAVATGGCAPAGGDGGGPLEGVSWSLTSYEKGGALTAVGAGADATLRFANGRAGGRIVNTYSAPYKAASDGTLSFEAPASTMMAGPPEGMALESAYFAALKKVASYRSDGATLTMRDAEGRDVLVFTRSDGSLAGSWSVSGYRDGAEALRSPIAQTAPSVAFTPDGAVTGDGGVNTFRGTYRVSGADGIGIGPLASTRTSGPPALMRQEASILAALQAAATYRLEGGRCTLLDAEGATLLTLNRTAQ